MCLGTEGQGVARTRASDRGESDSPEDGDGAHTGSCSQPPPTRAPCPSDQCGSPNRGPSLLHEAAPTPHPPLPGPIWTARCVKQGGALGTETKCPRLSTAGFCPSPLCGPGQQVLLYSGHLAAKTEGTFALCQLESARLLTFGHCPLQPAVCFRFTPLCSSLKEKSPPVESTGQSHVIPT